MPQAVALIIVLLAGSFLAKVSWERKIEKKSCLNQWGKDAGRKLLDADLLDDVADFWRKKKETIPPNRHVDDITWNDLNMDDVFRLVDATQSVAGSEVLYAMLRDTGAEEARLSRRREAADCFARDEQTRFQVTKALRKINRGHFHGAHRYLWQAEFMYPKNRQVYTLLGLILLVLIVSSLFVSRLFPLVILSMAINAVVYYKCSPLWKKEELALKYISSVIGAANKLLEVKAPQLKGYVQDMRDACKVLKPVLRWVPVFSVNGTTLEELIIDYIKIFFLFDVFAYCRIIRHLVKRQQELRVVFETVGEMDACTALSQMRQRYPALCEPVFLNDRAVEGEGVLHPLVQDCVPNSFVWRQNILLTGSNASGKSTFIKAVAINAILAQTLGVCFAQAFRMPRARVMTSMAIRDDVQAGDSYFIRELKSLKRIVDAARDGGFLLCFIDEILRGTNTQERIAASSSLLESLTADNILCMATTHDIELTKLLHPLYQNWHFREEMADGRITFTFLLHEGPTTTRNAIALLKQMGFDEGVIQNARRRAEEFTKSGKWE